VPPRLHGKPQHKHHRGESPLDLAGRRAERAKELYSEADAEQEKSMSDIKFDGDWVVIEGAMRVVANDIVLDHPNRRKNTNGTRRAFVHDFNDGLTLNWGSDYPGGVTINGRVVIADRIASPFLRLETIDLMLDHPQRRKTTAGSRRALVHDFNDGLTINWGGDYPGGVTIQGNVVCPGTLKVGSYEIQQTIQGLLTRIGQLETRVQALGG
jgi:hypothetical protein